MRQAIIEQAFDLIDEKMSNVAENYINGKMSWEEYKAYSEGVTDVLKALGHHQRFSAYLDSRCEIKR